MRLLLGERRQVCHLASMYKSVKWTPEREQALQKRTRAKLQARRPRQNDKELGRAREEAKRRYRERKGLPGPVDVWLATKLAQGISDDVPSPLSPDDVHCSVHVCRIPVCFAYKRAGLPNAYEH